MYSDFINEDERLTPVFVYGSLKSGYWNNSILSRNEGNAYLGQYVTKDDTFQMKSLGAFPGVSKGGTYAIVGELYNVTRATLDSLDRLEGNGSFYTRELVDLEGCDHQAWIYLLPRDGDFYHSRGSYDESVDTRVVNGRQLASWDRSR